MRAREVPEQEATLLEGTIAPTNLDIAPSFYHKSLGAVAQLPFTALTTGTEGA